ncbi:unnamed protein product [Durusdinium trenchii]|uniref:Uncharacterized protein n=1 Tax=Durusdinium trenchii TaxID=1381693 RepID=A0ABP0JZF6_9DINO
MKEAQRNAVTPSHHDPQKVPCLPRPAVRVLPKKRVAERRAPGCTCRRGMQHTKAWKRRRVACGVAAVCSGPSPARRAGGSCCWALRSRWWAPGVEVALMVLRGPLLDLLGFVLKVCEYFLKPLLLVTDVVPPPVLELLGVISIGGTAAYLCYKDPNTACLFVVLLLAGGGYFLASVTIWYKPIDASKDFLQLSDDHPIGPVALNGLGLP